MNVMKVNLLPFGRITEIIGINPVVDEAVVDTDSLITLLRQLYPALTESKFLIAVDKKVINENTPLHDNCTVALLPPFSGG